MFSIAWNSLLLDIEKFRMDLMMGNLCDHQSSSLREMRYQQQRATDVISTEFQSLPFTLLLVSLLKLF